MTREEKIKEVRGKIHSANPNVPLLEAFQIEARKFDVATSTLYNWCQNLNVPNKRKVEFCKRYMVGWNDLYPFNQHLEEN